VTEQELEKALRAALRAADPGDDFADGVLARLDAADAADAADVADVAPAAIVMPAAQHRRRTPLRRWGLAALLAACVIAGIGLVRWRQQTLDWQRGLAARAQLLQALNIASANVNAVRAAVIREEEPMP